MDFSTSLNYSIPWLPVSSMTPSGLCLETGAPVDELSVFGDPNAYNCRAYNPRWMRCFTSIILIIIHQTIYHPFIK